eukprot:scaffold72099_cov18-Tisochrysis_lutea.AAC.1
MEWAVWEEAGMVPAPSWPFQPTHMRARVHTHTQTHTPLCAIHVPQGSVAFKPRRGDALLFWSAQPDGKTIDPASTHEGCAVEAGA